MSMFTDLATYLTPKLNAIIDKVNDKVDKVPGKVLTSNDFTTVLLNKLNSIASGAQVNENSFEQISVTDDNGAKPDVLASNDTDTFTLEGKNGIEMASNASTKVITIDGASKVDKVAGKDLSTNDFTNADHNKLNGIQAGAQVNQEALAVITALNPAGSPDGSYGAASVSDSFEIQGVNGIRTSITGNVIQVDGASVSVPDATTSVKGKVQIGSGLSVAAGVVSIDTTVIAQRTYVDAQVAALINAAPGALDTLQELADAIGNDANFATTMTNALASKQDATALGVVADFSTHMNANLNALI